jgi:hypothetical protein
MKDQTYPRQLHVKLTKQEWDTLEEAKVLSGASTYTQTVTEALYRHATIERERILRMQQLLKDRP